MFFQWVRQTEEPVQQFLGVWKMVQATKKSNLDAQETFS